MINLKEPRSALKIVPLNKIHTSQSRARMRKLTVHDHMTHVVKIDILTGREEIGNLYFDLNSIFIAHLSKTKHFLKTCTVNK